MESNRQKKKKESNFVVQGSILAVASIVVRIIGIAYRIPMINIIGDEGMGYYGTAFNVYNIALLLSWFPRDLQENNTGTPRGSCARHSAMQRSLVHLRPQ